MTLDRLATATPRLFSSAKHLLEDLGHDLRYAVRQVKRSPGFAALAVLCLGLGIGANTSIFSALNSVLFRPLPGARPGQLLMLRRGTIANFSCSSLRA